MWESSEIYLSILSESRYRTLTLSCPTLMPCAFPLQEKISFLSFLLFSHPKGVAQTQLLTATLPEPGFLHFASLLPSCKLSLLSCIRQPLLLDPYKPRWCHDSRRIKLPCLRRLEGLRQLKNEEVCARAEQPNTSPGYTETSQQLKMSLAVTLHNNWNGLPGETMGCRWFIPVQMHHLLKLPHRWQYETFHLR